MFNFFANNYEQRVVARYECPSDRYPFVIDTAAVCDSTKPYETAVKHPSYNDGKWVIVELYDTKEEAQAGHDRWITTMSELPEKLIDVSSAGVAMLCDIGEEGMAWREVCKK